MQPNTYPWDRDGNLIVPRYGIRVAMGMALLAAGAFCIFASLEDRAWRKDHPTPANGFSDPLWMVFLWIALPLVPLILSAVLLSRRSEVPKAAGAGVAAGVFACGLFAAIAIFLGRSTILARLLIAGKSYSQDLAFFVCSVWIVVSAFRIAAKAGWGIFCLPRLPRLSAWPR